MNQCACWSISIFQYLLRPANLLGEGIRSLDLKFSEIDQLPLNARQLGGVRAFQKAPVWLYAEEAENEFSLVGGQSLLQPENGF